MNVMEDLAAMNHYAKKVQNYYSGNRRNGSCSPSPNRGRRDYDQQGDRRRRSPSPKRGSDRDYVRDQSGYSRDRNNNSVVS